MAGGIRRSCVGFLIAILTCFLPLGGSLRAESLSGTAFAVTEAGDLVTDGAVVSGCTVVDIELDTGRATAAIAASDPTSGLAILRLNQKVQNVAVLRQSPALRAGDQVVTYGYVLAGTSPSQGHLTIGYLSTLGDPDPDRIPMTTAVASGSRGGALLDLSGHVIGVVTGRPATDGYMPYYPGVAVSRDVLKRFLAAHGIAAAEAHSGEALSPADVGDRARLFSYAVRCDRPPSPQSMGPATALGGTSHGLSTILGDPGTASGTPTTGPLQRTDPPAVGPSSPDNKRGATVPIRPPAAALPEDAQRAVLYEEDPTDPEGHAYAGSVVWSTRMAAAGGQPPEAVVHAEVQLPDRSLHVAMELRRNADPALPASHVIELTFSAENSAFSGIANVPGLLMKASENTRGVALAGLAVKVTQGAFLVGLSAVEADRRRNMALLRDRTWFDIPIVYRNGRRAILAIEKGATGERMFAAAFADWDQAAGAAKPQPGSSDPR